MVEEVVFDESEKKDYIEVPLPPVEKEEPVEKLVQELVKVSRKKSREISKELKQKKKMDKLEKMKAEKQLKQFVKKAAKGTSLKHYKKMLKQFNDGKVLNVGGGEND